MIKTTVLLNALHAKSGGGVNYIKNIVPCLADDDRLDLMVYIHRSQSEKFSYLDKYVRVITTDHKGGFWRTPWHEQFVIPAAAKELGAHVIYSPANYGPLFGGCVTVIMLRNANTVGLVERRPIRDYREFCGLAWSL